MENVVLIIHLLLALSLIGAVLLQRSEGGGLGMGSGGGGNGAMAGRAPGTAMGKVTWVLAIAFICTSIALTIIAAEKSAGSSVLDRIGAPTPVPEVTAPETPTEGGSLLPPAAGDTGPLTPRAD